MTTERPQPRPRGRPRERDRQQRRSDVLDAAFAELLEHGSAFTMDGVARRAGSSKETLYAWFGSREGVLLALRDREASDTVGRVASMFADAGADHEVVLRRFAIGLLTLLTGTDSVALNRAAMTSPTLAELILGQGRYAVGPVVERYLASLHDGGVLHVPDPPQAFRTLYGLIIQDSQIRVLLGEPAPSKRQIDRQASTAVSDFLRLTARG